MQKPPVKEVISHNMYLKILLWLSLCLQNELYRSKMFHLAVHMRVTNFFKKLQAI